MLRILIEEKQHWNLLYDTSCWLVVVSLVLACIFLAVTYVYVSCYLAEVGIGSSYLLPGIPQTYPHFSWQTFPFIMHVSYYMGMCGTTSACLDVWKRLSSATTYYYCYSIYIVLCQRKRKKPLMQSCILNLQQTSP